MQIVDKKNNIGGKNLDFVSKKFFEKFLKNCLTKWQFLCIIIYVAEVSTPKREHGSIAQLGEHLPYKQEVTGSSPVVPTKIWPRGAVG